MKRDASHVDEAGFLQFPSNNDAVWVFDIQQGKNFRLTINIRGVRVVHMGRTFVRLMQFFPPWQKAPIIDPGALMPYFYA